MYKTLTDQHEDITLSNEQNIFSNDKHEAEAVINEHNIYPQTIFLIVRVINQIYRNIIFIL